MLVINNEINTKELEFLEKVSTKIKEGANTFFVQELIYLSIFLAILAIIIALSAESRTGVFYTTTAFLIGCLSSIFSAYICMKVATETSYRTTYQSSVSLSSAFNMSFYGGNIIGLGLVCFPLMVLTILFLVFKGN